jgi:hypothetical protein
VLGGGLDQRKWSASGRWDGRETVGLPLYGFVEWAETHEYSDDRRVFGFDTFLAEASWQVHAWMFGVRVERTERPEEERLLDPFRVARPHTDANIIGVTRWKTLAIHAQHDLNVIGFTAQPFVEAAKSTVRELSGGIFDPVAFYGTDRLWNISIGIKVDFGLRHERMGRYGVALSKDHAHEM